MIRKITSKFREIVSDQDLNKKSGLLAEQLKLTLNLKLKPVYLQLYD